MKNIKMKTFKILFLLLLTFTTNEASEYANNQYSSHQPSPTLCSVEQVLGRTFVLQVLGNLCIKIEAIENGEISLSTDDSNNPCSNIESSSFQTIGFYENKIGNKIIYGKGKMKIVQNGWDAEIEFKKYPSSLAEHFRLLKLDSSENKFVAEVLMPSCELPTLQPSSTQKPSSQPSVLPSLIPTTIATSFPTIAPTRIHSSHPSFLPTQISSASPSNSPIKSPPKKKKISTNIKCMLDDGRDCNEMSPFLPKDCGEIDLRFEYEYCNNNAFEIEMIDRRSKVTLWNKNEIDDNFDNSNLAIGECRTYIKDIQVDTCTRTGVNTYIELAGWVDGFENVKGSFCFGYKFLRFEFPR